MSPGSKAETSDWVKVSVDFPVLSVRNLESETNQLLLDLLLCVAGVPRGVHGAVYSLPKRVNQDLSTLQLHSRGGALLDRR
jgi:hypothetical protein